MQAFASGVWWKEGTEATKWLSWLQSYLKVSCGTKIYFKFSTWPSRHPFSKSQQDYHLLLLPGVLLQWPPPLPPAPALPPGTRAQAPLALSASLLKASHSLFCHDFPSPLHPLEVIAISLFINSRSYGAGRSENRLSFSTTAIWRPGVPLRDCGPALLAMVQPQGGARVRIDSKPSEPPALSARFLYTGPHNLFSICLKWWQCVFPKLS